MHVCECIALHVCELVVITSTLQLVFWGRIKQMPCSTNPVTLRIMQDVHLWAHNDTALQIESRHFQAIILHDAQLWAHDTVKL